MDEPNKGFLLTNPGYATDIDNKGMEYIGQYQKFCD